MASFFNFVLGHFYSPLLRSDNHFYIARPPACLSTHLYLMFHIIKLCLPRSTLQVTTHAAKPDAHVCLRNTSQAGGPTGGAVFPTIVAEHPCAVLVHFGGSRTSRTRDIDGNFSKSVLRWLSLYPAAVGRGSDRGVTCYYTISTDKAIPGTSSRSG